MKKIFVPGDGSENALRAVRYAAAEAKNRDPAAAVELLHVVEPFYAVHFMSSEPNALQPRRNARRRGRRGGHRDGDEKPSMVMKGA